MIVLPVIANFLAGVFLCNGIPHLAAGLRGEAFPTPFAQPRGVGLSSAFVNFLWGTFNGFIGVLLLWIFPIVGGNKLGFAALVLGFLLLGMYLSWHFSKVRKGA